MITNTKVTEQNNIYLGELVYFSFYTFAFDSFAFDCKSKGQKQRLK
jgi:hypothetical protein